MIKTNNDIFETFSIIPQMDMKHLLHQDNFYELKDILSYIKCSVCNIHMLDPKMCLSCNKNLCKKCHKSNCNHDLVLSRHLKSILENLKLKCKYLSNGCDDESTFNYFSLKKHSESCLMYKKAFKEISQQSILESKENKSKFAEKNEIENDNFKINTNIFKNLSFPSKILNEGDISKINKITCSCGETISDDNNVKEAYINHKKNCVLKNNEYSVIYQNTVSNNNNFPNDKENDIEDSKVFLNSNLNIKETLVSDFMSKIELIQKNFYDLSVQRNNEYISKVQSSLEKFLGLINDKKEKIKELEFEISEYHKKNNDSKDYVPDKYLEKNKEYQRLIAEENLLKDKEFEAKHDLDKAKQEYIHKEKKGEEEVTNIINDYKSKLQQLEAQELWLKEEISTYDPELINSVFSDSDTCNLCKDSNVNNKKYYCQKCCRRYCAGICALLCVNSGCNKTSKYICPTCVPKCGLCRKNIYCESCKKSCFYKECPNTFCPDCYKKNAHQARGPTSNCAFFTCEIDKTKACLMSSLFCTKCEKRLCNNCIFNDKEHFSNIFK